MIVHLLESTLLLAMAILIAHLPRLAARTRYAIVFTALMKFAIPSAIVPRLLAAFGIDLTGMKGTIVISALGPLSMASLPQTSAPVWPMALAAIWGSSSLSRTRRPRSAAACSTTIRISVSISSLNTIWLESACDAFIMDPISS